MKSKILIIVGMIVLVLSYSCDRQKYAKGPLDVIYVLADDESKKELKTVIDTLGTYGIRTPKFQAFYDVKWFTFRDIPFVKEYHHVVIVANLNNEVGEEIARKLLNPKQFKDAERDSLNIFFIKDLWVKDQAVIFIAGKDFQKLRRAISSNVGWIYRKIDENFVNISNKYIFKYGEQRNLSRYLWGKYHWTMRIQHDYMIVHEYEDKNFVWLGRGFPYRWISVSWANGFEPKWLTEPGLFERRNKIGEIYGGIGTDKRFLGFYWTEFAGYNALKMYGLWYHKKEAKGGPFVTYSFYDEETDRTFIIDLLVFAPGEKVTLILRQADLMIRTFTTKPDFKL
ncbi:MAG: DUF4837 family protein [Candidatus Marinimicrobia bacterium]|nr:DUF4837 family protein [Candidatus Neomarinimicrobiota bacterium]